MAKTKSSNKVSAPGKAAKSRSRTGAKKLAGASSSPPAAAADRPAKRSRPASFAYCSGTAARASPSLLQPWGGSPTPPERP